METVYGHFYCGTPSVSPRNAGIVPGGLYQGDESDYSGESEYQINSKQHTVCGEDVSISFRKSPLKN